MREEQKKQPKATNCDFCLYFHEDEDTGLAVCHMALDEDEMLHFILGDFRACPYYRDNDEYRIVRRQN